MLLADANGPGTELPIIEADVANPTPEAIESPESPMGSPIETIEEIPVNATSDAGLSNDVASGTNWGSILIWIFIIAVIGFTVTLYLRNKK